MKHLFHVITLILFTTLFIGCTFHQEVHFNDDWSGTSKMTIDMSAMMALQGDGDGEESGMSLMNDEDFQESLKEMEQQEGISNVKVKEDTAKGIYEISYDFVNIELLNEGMSGSNMLADDGESVHKYFELKGKKTNLFYACCFLRIPNLTQKKAWRVWKKCSSL